jgi:hypothetical protein
MDSVPPIPQPAEGAPYGQTVEPERWVPRPWLKRWEDDDFTPRGPLNVGAGLLRAQGAVARDLFSDRNLNTYIAGCGLITVFASLLYGAILGSVGGAGQVAYAAIKFPVVIVGACGICLPSFFVFQALTGARLSLRQAVASVLMLGAAAGLILLGCAPIAWFFSVSTTEDAGAFLGLMHAVVIALSTTFGFHFIARTHRYVAWKHNERLFDGRVLALWFVLLVLVAAQMAHYLGPLDAERGMLETKRGFFLSALFEA